MRRDILPIKLPSPIADGDGDPVNVSDLRTAAVEIYGGTRSYSIAISWSTDGGQWQEVVSASAGAVVPTAIPDQAGWVKTTVSAFVSETDAPTVQVVGWNAQTAP